MDKISKFLLRLGKEERTFLLAIFDDILNLKLEVYDIKPLKGYKDIYRLKKGKVRIIFQKAGMKSVIIDVDFRKDIYKNF